MLRSGVASINDWPRMNSYDHVDKLYKTELISNEVDGAKHEYINMWPPPLIILFGYAIDVFYEEYICHFY